MQRPYTDQRLGNVQAEDYAKSIGYTITPG
jgi:hypothetical protein